jgi:CubicO group peptidase (beta-lactamase class C family)
MKYLVPPLAPAARNADPDHHGDPDPMPCAMPRHHHPSSALLLLLVGVLLTALPGGPHPAAGQEPASIPPGFGAAWADVAAVFHDEARSRGVVGGSLWFVRHGAVLAREHHGHADLAAGRAVNDETIFHWASNTKTLTGIAVLQLRDRGLLSLDDPAVRWLPELREVHAPYGPIEEVTIRRLLSHTAGFRSSTWPWGGDQPWHPFEPTRWEQLAAMMPWTELLFEPGSRFGYSNPGIVFLARIVEVVSGEAWEAYVAERILRPLDMRRSYFRLTPPHLAPYRSDAYWLEGGRAVARGPDFDPGITVSNSGLNAPIPDLIRYLAFLSGALGESVLARSSLEGMWAPMVPVGEGAAWGEPHEEMGLTFFVTRQADGRLVGHAGRQWNHLSFFYLDPDTGAGAIGVVNTDGAPGPDRSLDARAFINDIRARLVADVFPLFR